MNVVTDERLKETGAIQVHDTTSLRCQLGVDEVHVRCGRTLIGSIYGDLCTAVDFCADDTVSLAMVMNAMTTMV